MPSRKDRIQKVYAHWKTLVEVVRKKRWSENGIHKDHILAVFAGVVRAEIIADAYRGGLQWAGVEDGAELAGLKVYARVEDGRLQLQYDITKTMLSSTPQVEQFAVC